MRVLPSILRQAQDERKSGELLRNARARRVRRRQMAIDLTRRRFGQHRFGNALLYFDFTCGLVELPQRQAPAPIVDGGMTAETSGGAGVTGSDADFGFHCLHVSGRCTPHVQGVCPFNVTGIRRHAF